MDHAGHSQLPPLLNPLSPLPKRIFTVFQNNNSLTAVVPRDSNAKAATVPGQNGLSTTSTPPVLSLKVNIHTPPEEDHARTPQLPRSSSTQPSHGQCSMELNRSRALWEAQVQSQSVLMPATGVLTRAVSSRTVEPQPSTTPLLPSVTKQTEPGSSETHGEPPGVNKDSSDSLPEEPVVLTSMPLSQTWHDPRNDSLLRLFYQKFSYFLS